MSRIRALAPEHPWLLPGDVTVTDGRPVRRSARDWTVDSLLFLASLIIVALNAVEAAPRDDALVLDAAAHGSAWSVPLDPLAGLIASGALWLRRRWPVALAAVVIALSTLFATTLLVEVVLLLTVIVRHRLSLAVALCAAFVGAGVVYNLLRPDPGMSAWSNAVMNVFLGACLLAWGMFLRARRQLVLSLCERAHRAEVEQRLRVAQARQRERTRIAREMHDVLAHRISLLSLHAGALEFRPDAPQEEIVRAAGVIRANAHTALEELRTVIGVLREGDTEDTPQRPQPTMVDLPALIAEVREAGMRVDLRTQITEASEVSAAIGRTAYRVVQEGLTNARKHAAGTRVTVTITGAAGDGLTVEICNPRPVGSPAPIPGAGLGLIGLAERVELIDGTLEDGPAPGGGFRLRAWLPWST